MKNRSFMSRKMRVYILIVILLAGCQPAGPTGGTALKADAASGCRQVEFLEMKALSEVATTWRYRVGQPACDHQVSSWMLELPACATVVEASPGAWEVISPELPFQMNGIRWPSGAGAQNAEFSVTLLGDLAEGTTRAGVEAESISIDSIKGPVCRDLARLPTATPGAGAATVKIKVQSANCRALPVGKSRKIILLYRSQEAEILGRNEDPNNPWWYVKIPGQEGNCWLWGRTVTTTGSLENVPVLGR